MKKNKLMVAELNIKNSVSLIVSCLQLHLSPSDARFCNNGANMPVSMGFSCPPCHQPINLLNGAAQDNTTTIHKTWYYMTDILDILEKSDRFVYN